MASIPHKDSITGDDGDGGSSSASNDLSQYGKIDTSNINNQLWMVKIPHDLGFAWDKAEEGAVLGTLTFTKGGGVAITNNNAAAKGPNNGNNKQQQQGPRKVPANNRAAALRNNNKQIKQSLHVKVSDDIATANPKIPHGYTVEAMTKRVPVLHPFTRRQDGSVDMHGSIARTCTFQMQRNDRYRKLCKDRLLETVTSNKFVKPVDTSELSMRNARGAGAGSGDGFGDAVQKHGKSILEAAERGGVDSKKRKFEGQSIRSIIFKLFETQRFWTVKELKNASGRVEKEIRPVLNELCDFRRNGEQKGTWELQKQYQMQGTEDVT